MDYHRMFIALEADDVSASAQEEQGNTVGNTTNNTEEQDELTNTSDILGTKNSDIGEDSDSDNNVDENFTDTEESEEEMNEDEISDEELNDTSNDISNEEDELITRKKEILRNNMVYLYDIIYDNITTLKNGSIKINTKEEIESLDRIIDNLSDCAEVLYATLTKNYKDSKYEDIKKIYISAKKLFDISIKMLYNHFDTMENATSNKNRLN